MPRFSYAPEREKGLPSYRLHRPSGKAVVTLNGEDIYLGPHGTKASRAEYDRVVGEWLSAGRCRPRSAESADLTVAEIGVAYLRFAQGYYTKDGQPTGELAPLKSAIKFLRKHYGRNAARDFGPLSLETLQRKGIEKGWSRHTINTHIDRIRRCFRWAVAKELIPPTTYQALCALPGLRKGRTAAREPEPIAPVDDRVVDATLPHLPEVLADLVRLQRLTGTRPGELCILRPMDVDTSGDLWVYRPTRHKTEHHNRERTIFIGPKAQTILRPYLLRAKTSYCFSPEESEKKRNAIRRANRQSPMTPSQASRKPKRNRKHRPGETYTVGCYRRAITRAVELANRDIIEEAALMGIEPVLLPHWTPNQLRHSAATDIRRHYNLEAVQATLGHASMNTSEIYAEKNLALAAEVMRAIG